jgi:hypothetical protein
MKSSVRLNDGSVSVQLGDLRMTFPDEPFWWCVMRRTAETVAELGSGDLDAGRG